MKHLHKFASVLLALVMAFSLMAPAFASGDGETAPQANENVTLTIENANEGHTYGAFQIFTGTLGTTTSTVEPSLGDETNPLRTTMSNVKWGNGIDQNKIATLLSDLSVTLPNGVQETSAEAARLAAEAMATYTATGTEENGKTPAKLADIINKALASSTNYTANAPESGKYTIAMPAGYYLIKDTATVSGNDTATDFMLQVLQNEVMKPKADGTPVVEKKIKEGDTLTDATQVAIGSKVTFQLKATLPEAVGTYKKYHLNFVDTLSTGLTYTAEDAKLTVKVVKDITATTTDEEFAQKLASATPLASGAYTASFENQVLTVKFADVKQAPINAVGGEVIVVEYKATLNENASIGTDEGNINDVKLQYANDPNWDGDGNPPEGETPKDTVIVFTFEVDNTKVTKDDEGSNVALSGVKFIIGKADTSEGAAADAKVWAEVENGIVKNWNKAENSATRLVSAEDTGVFNIKGLAAGTYYLREVETLPGYNMLTSDIVIVITADLNKEWSTDQVQDAIGNGGITATIDGTPVKMNVTEGDTTTATEKLDGIVPNTIINLKGAQLPETGGIGTTIFYIVGGLLTVGAVVLLVTKKRMSADSDK